MPSASVDTFKPVFVISLVLRRLMFGLLKSLEPPSSPSCNIHHAGVAKSAGWS
jgi:hypothetical protein